MFQVLRERKVADLQAPWREGGASRSDSADLKSPWFSVINPCFILFFTRNKAMAYRTWRFCSWREVVLPCREVPGLCSKAAPGCFGWFGGKLWSLHQLFQIGGPLVANCGWKLWPLSKKLGSNRPQGLTAWSLQGPRSPVNNFVIRGGEWEERDANLPSQRCIIGPKPWWNFAFFFFSLPEYNLELNSFLRKHHTENEV